MATGGKEDNDKFNGDQKENLSLNGEEESNTKNLNNEPEGSEENKKSTNREENPFSFKRFLKAADGSHANGFRPSSNRIINLDLANDLPDFVQGHYNSSENDNKRLILNPIDGNLPDFALHDSNKSLGARPKIYNRVLPMFNNNVENIEETHTEAHSSNASDNCSNSLPDFLSDSGIGSTCNREASNNNADVLASFKSHNSELLKRLDDLTQMLDSERERSHRLSLELNKMKKDEAIVLEHVLPQLGPSTVADQEKNKSNDQLQNKIKVLQDQVDSLQKQQSACTCNSESRNQLKQASRKVSTAADEVQLHLRQLMMSVEQLKVLSENVASCPTSTSASSSTTVNTPPNNPLQ